MTVSSNDINDKNVLEGIDKHCGKKSLVSNMADMKNQFKSVASTGDQITKQLTKVNTVVAQQGKS